MKKNPEYHISRLNNLIRQVPTLIEQRQHKRALAKLKQVLIASPNNLDALVWSAEIFRSIGDTRQSGKFFDKAIELKTDFFRAIHGRALLRYELNHLPAAISDFNKLIELKPKIPEIYNNRGNLFLMRGDFDKALEDFNLAIALNPKSANTLNCRGLVYHKLGNLQLALEDFNASLIIKHDFPSAIFNRGNLLKDMSRLNEAIADYERVLSVLPNFAPAFNNRGTIKRTLGNLDEALKDFNAAIRLDTKFQGAYYNRGNIFKELRRFDQAKRDLNIAIALKPNDANAYNARGNIFKELYKPERAIGDFKKAIALQPKLADAYNNRGIVYSEMRRSREALYDFEKAISISPHLGPTHRQISMLKKYSDSDPHIKMMQGLLSDKKTSANDRCHLLYALAKASQDISDTKAAFEYFFQGGALKKKLLNYDIHQDEIFFEFISNNFDKFLECSPTNAQNNKSIQPIFIIGMPRSGTSLIEQIISSHTSVFGAGELPFWSYYTTQLFHGKLDYNKKTLEQLRRLYSKQIISIASGKKYVTDKMPNNFLSIGLIKSAFPYAKFIHVERNPAAVCWSNYTNFFAGNSLSYSYDLEDVVKYYNLYHELMNCWKKNLKSEIYNVSYEDLTNDPEPEIKRLIGYIELPWEEACLFPQKNRRAVRTASLSQIGKPIYRNSSISWKRYSELIGNKFDLLPCVD